jgi:predicted amidohydrolase
MSERGAKIICHPVLFTDHTGQAHLELLMRANAVFSHCYVLTANHCGVKQNGAVIWGHSMIVDPWGTVLAQAGHDEEELLVAEIDLDYCDDLRGRLGCMTNRRTDIYSLTEL